MQKQPLITVLIPVYNAEKYLPFAIESIINQTYKNLEILIINDGSTDRSEEIILSYNDPRIRYIRQENVGVGETLRRGVELAKGELIRRMDADDITSLDSIEVQVNFLLKNPQVGLIAAQQCHITENGKIAWNKKLPRDEWFNGKPYRILTFDDFTAEKTAPVVHGTVMFYRDLALEVGNYRPWFRVAEDFDLWLRIMERKQAVILNRCLYHLRIHGSSATARYNHILKFYRQKAIEFSQLRRRGMPDPLQKGEYPPKPNDLPEHSEKPRPNGKVVRDDLSFMYSFALDAKDFKLWFKVTSEILKYGWRRGKTYKMLLLPLLGNRLTQTLVKLKRRLKRLVSFRKYN